MAYKIKQRAGNGVFFVEFEGLDGKRQRVSLGTRDEKAARELGRERYLAAIRGDEAPAPVVTGKTTTLTLDQAFNKMLLDDWHPSKAKTWRNITSDCKVIGAVLGHKEVAELTYEDFREFERASLAKGHSVGTIKRRLARIGVVLNKCHRAWLNPATKRPYVERLPVFPNVGKANVRQRDLSEADEQRVLAFCDEQAGKTQRGHQWWLFKQFIVWQIDTGMRKSETLRIDAGRIKDGCVILHDGETKNGEGRAIPLTSRLIKMVGLFDQMGLKGPFFSALSPGKIHDMWDTMRNALNLGDIVIHDLRHTRGQRLDDADVPIEVIAELLGHKDIRVTSRVYTRRKTERLKRWVAAVEAGDTAEHRLRLVS